MMLHPPNTFLIFWTKRQLKDWIKELKLRSKIWRNKSVPTLKQIKAELTKRKCN